MAFVSTEQSKTVKQALQAEFPAKDGWKFSVSIEHHSSLRVAIMQAPINLIESTDEYDQRNQYQSFNVYHLDNYSNRETLEKIHAIANKGNFDESDSMTDYFHVGFYLDITAGKWNKPFVHVPAAAPEASQETAADQDSAASQQTVILGEIKMNNNIETTATAEETAAPEADQTITMEQFLIHVGDQKFVENGVEYDPEESEAVSYSHQVSAREIFETAERYAARYNCEFFTPDHVFDLYRETIENGELITVEENTKKRESARRDRLERAATGIASASGLKVASTEFVDHLYSLIEGVRDQRNGMREDGLCIGFGATAEQWFDDHNYLGGQIGEINELIEWLDEFCPLFMMRYREEKAAIGARVCDLCGKPNAEAGSFHKSCADEENFIADQISADRIF